MSCYVFAEADYDVAAEKNKKIPFPTKKVLRIQQKKCKVYLEWKERMQIHEH